MDEELLKGFRESINDLSPLLRYPVLLLIADMVKEELPKAKKAHDEECENMINRFMELVREVSNDD